MIMAKAKWTRQLPKKPGWYWYRNINGTIWIECVENIRGYIVTIEPSGDTTNVDVYNGEWQGPIEPDMSEEGVA